MSPARTEQVGSIKWWEVFSARFGKRLTDREFEVWEGEIEEEIRNCSHAEILDAVRALGEDKRKGHLKYTPTVEHIIGKVIYLRWIENQDRAAADDHYNQGSECVCRGQGWILCRPNFGYYDGGEVEVPCSCSKGIAIARKAYSDADKAFHDKLRRFAVN